MKKLVILSALTLFCTTAFCQAKPAKADTTKGHGQTADYKVPATQYVIIMNEAQVMELFGFIQNADMWSDKGRNVYFEKLKTLVTVIPAVPDTARKK